MPMKSETKVLKILNKIHTHTKKTIKKNSFAGRVGWGDRIAHLGRATSRLVLDQYYTRVKKHLRPQFDYLSELYLSLIYLESLKTYAYYLHVIQNVPNQKQVMQKKHFVYTNEKKQCIMFYCQNLLKECFNMIILH